MVQTQKTSIGMGRESSLGGGLELLVRDNPEVPLYSPNGLEITKNGMCNPARVRDSARIIHDYIRAVGLDNKSRIMHAVEGKILSVPVLEPGTDPSIPDSYGCEDAHAITIKNPQTGNLEVLMLYVAFDGWDDDGFGMNSIVLATSKNFYNFKKEGVVNNGGVPDKDCVPLYHNGKLYVFRRPMYKGTTGWGIVVSEFDREAMGVRDLGTIKPKQPWERDRIGAGFALTLEGGDILLCYHGVRDESEYITYRLGFMILDGKDPAKVLYRTKRPVMEPQTDIELHGFLRSGQARSGEKPKRIVIPTAGSLDGDILTVVYGEGDRCSATATGNILRILDYVTCKENRAA